MNKEYDLLYDQKAQQKPTIPKQLNSEIPLDPRNNKQEFYRISQRAAKSKEMMIKLGWKVVALTREQVDLALFCLAILQAELNAPFAFFASNNRGEQGFEIKDVWIEWHILLSSASKDEKNCKDLLQLSIYNFCGREVLPRLREFVVKYLDWSYMCSEQFKDSRVIDIFQKEVKSPLKELMKTFRVGKSYLQ